MRRLVALMSLLVLLTPFVSAQIGIPEPPVPACVEGVIGGGLLGSDSPSLPRRTEFAMEVYRYRFRCPWEPCEYIRGNFWLRLWEESGTVAVLRTERIEQFLLEETSEGWLARFSGPAVVTISRGGSSRSFRGRVAVQALDGRPSPCLDCPTDWLRVTFTSPDLPQPITFEGYVIPRTGEIRTFRRCG